MHRSHVRAAVMVAVVGVLASGSGDRVHAQAVTFFEHIDYVGASFGTAEDMAFVGWEWNDQISSVDVPPNTTVTLYEHADFGGQSLTLIYPNSDLRWFAGPGADGTWNDAASSIRVSGTTPPPPSAEDRDFDGLNDGLEAELASRFFPTLHFDNSEGCAVPNPLRIIYRARPLSYQGVTYHNEIAIHYVILYDWDCGSPGHPGDNESFVVYLTHMHGSWLFRGLAATAHYDDFGEVASKGYSQHLWISENKHANYANFSDCGYGWAFDDCDDPGRSASYQLFNVGEPNGMLIEDLGDVHHTWRNEGVWDNSHFKEAGKITQQLYLRRYYRLTHPPQHYACQVDCQDVYNTCMLEYYNDHCEPERYYCDQRCDVISWDE